MGPKVGATSEEFGRAKPDWLRRHVPPANGIPVDDVKVFQRAVRSHWGIEGRTRCIWRLDVTCREDDSRIRRGNTPHNIGVIRHMAMNLIKREKTKISHWKKRIRAALNDAFQDKLLIGK